MIRTKLNKFYGDKVVPPSGCLLLKRTLPNVVSHCPYMMAALPTNHAFYFYGEASTWCREVQLWRDAGRKGPAPHLPSVEETAVDAAIYASKYCSKPDYNDGVNTLCASVRKLQEAHASTRPDTNAPTVQGIKTLQRLLNVQQGSTIRAASMSAHLNMGRPSHFMTFDTQPQGAVHRPPGPAAGVLISASSGPGFS